MAIPCELLGSAGDVQGKGHSRAVHSTEGHAPCWTKEVLSFCFLLCDVSLPLCGGAQAKQAISKARLLPPGLPTHLAASICSGLVSALISTPADVIKTRLMAQAVGPNQQQLQPQRPQQQTPVQPGAAAGAAAAQQQASGPASPQHTSSRLYSSTAARSAGVCSSTGHSHMQCGADASHAAAVGSEPARRGGRWMLQQQQSVNAMSSRAGSVPVMPHYNGMLDCAVQTVRQEGLLALYKG